MNTTLALVVLFSMSWVAIVINQVLPLLKAPLAKVKREFIVLQLIVGTFVLISAWVTYRDLHGVAIALWAVYQLICTVLLHLLSKLDYYIDDLLQEILLLSILSAGVTLMLSFWYFGIEITSMVILVRLFVVFIGAILLALTKVLGHAISKWWPLGVYLFLVAVKWAVLPLWGIWSLIMIFVYATLVGYVVHWLVSTTHAEKVLAWNVSPVKAWLLLVLSAGVLVIAF